MSTKVGTKGQVVIEKPIREQLGIEPGFLTLQRVVGRHVEILFFPPDHERSLRGALAGEVRRSVRGPEAWAQAEEEAWRRAAEVAEGDDGPDAEDEDG